MNPTLWLESVEEAVDQIIRFMTRDERDETKGMVEQDLVSIVRRLGFEKLHYAV